MEKDTRKRALSAALIAIATAGAFAGPAAAGGNDGAPNGQPPAHAPAHGVRGETPPPHAGQPQQAPPQQAPAHGKRGTQPRSTKPRRATAPKPAKARAPKAARPAPPAHAPAHGVRGTKPSGARNVKGRSPDDRGARAKENQGGGQPRGTLCHATGSEKNPYVEIEIANPGILHAHEGHQDDGDIIPAPAGGCPSTLEGAARSVAGTGASGVETAGPATGSAASGSPGAPAGETASGIISSSQMGTTGAADQIQVLGEIDTEAGTAETSDGSPASVPTADVEEGTNGLPFTGLSLIAVILAGLAALLTGVALWRATRAPRRPTA